IKGGVTQTASSTEYLENRVFSDNLYGGAVSVGGLIVMNSTTTGTKDFGSNNEVFADGGNVSALGVIIHDTGSQPIQNLAFSEDHTLQIGGGGATLIASGPGHQTNEILPHR